ncbi:hypothetical protein [Bacillus sp. B-jedd]|uniref:hypothetical protein n=1 Tax=Bacillus sp. B-jedd TaxID=1476857 RepID=UPI00051563D4|nr:hypothetical protein [Bacillus sp. B-jedd]CEG27368.1 hypothetical protein BN1002_02228 [Bacillus sp. B-jedd]
MELGKKLSLFGLAVAITTTAYLDSPFSIMNKNYSNVTVGARQASVMFEKSAPNLVEYEMKLADKQKRNGYIIETYREYEVKRDQEGKIIDSKPTSKVEEIKYRDPSFGLEQ